MSLGETQAALARLFTQRAAREAFAVSPPAAMAGVAPDEIARFAGSLAAKRRQDVEKWLPLTAKALGAGFAPLALSALAEPPPGARADALALAAILRGREDPLWIAELADYEAQFLRAWGPHPFFAARFYRWPVPRLAGLLAAGERIGEIRPGLTSALWARAPRVRLWHRWRTWTR